MHVPWNFGLEAQEAVDGGTVDGGNPPVEVGSLSHYLHGFIHPRRCRISSINSIPISRKIHKCFKEIIRTHIVFTPEV